MPHWLKRGRAAVVAVSVVLVAVGAGDLSGEVSQNRGSRPPETSGQAGTARSQPTQERNKTTSKGIPLDQPLRTQLGDLALKVPAGYLWPWPFEKRDPEIVGHVKELFFDFWMPDKRYLEVNTFSYIGFQPRERGREAPGPDSYPSRFVR